MNAQKTVSKEKMRRRLFAPKNRGRKVGAEDLAQFGKRTDLGQFGHRLFEPGYGRFSKEDFSETPKEGGGNDHHKRVLRRSIKAI